MSFEKTTVVTVTAASAVISWCCSPAVSREQVRTDSNVEGRLYKEYLDQVWARIGRTWGIAEARTPDFETTVSFELDAKGTAANINLDKGALSFVAGERVRKTLLACSPFPISPLKVPLHVSCKMRVRQGGLCLAVRIPEFGDANAEDVGTIADADMIKGLIDTVSNSKGSERRAALEELKSLGSGARPALPAILEATKDKDNSTVYRAFEALIAMGPAAKDALPAMIKNLRGADDRLRGQSVLVMASMGPAAEEAVPLLLEALDDRDTPVKEGAAKALRGMGSAVSQKAVNVLMQSAFHEYITFVPDIVAEFGAEAVPALIKGTEDDDGHMVHNSVEALYKMGDVAAPAVPALIRLVESKIGGQCEERAIETLGKLGPLAKQAVPALTATVQSGGEDYRWRAIDALGCIGPDAKESLSVLKQYLSGPEPDVRRRAKEAIRKIEAPR